MTTKPKLDLADLSVEQLLSGLATADLTPPNPIDLWIQSAPLYPGTTKVRAQDLYQQYREYMLAHPELGKPKAIRCWGKDMARRFKQGRGNRGIFYYVSRERDVVIPTSLKAGV